MKWRKIPFIEINAKSILQCAFNAVQHLTMLLSHEQTNKQTCKTNKFWLRQQIHACVLLLLFHTWNQFVTMTLGEISVKSSERLPYSSWLVWMRGRESMCNYVQCDDLVSLFPPENIQNEYVWFRLVHHMKITMFAMCDSSQAYPK